MEHNHPPRHTMNQEEKLPIVVAYGGGTNSTAMLCGFRERNIVPDLILFADTGGEMPHTYAHVKYMNEKCREWWGIGIEVVTKKFQGTHEPLELECIRKAMLPSLAYGRKACSMKHKLEPQKQRVRAWMDDTGVKVVTKAIGYDAGEGHRSVSKARTELGRDRVELNWYPLVDWQWRRADCYAAIMRHGLVQPGKSSCFFCPAMKRHEILRLREDHPDLYRRALAMEENLVVKGRVKGLYMGVPWSEVVAADDAQGKLFDWVETHDETRTPCGCYDG